ncbi:MAG: hemolysin III family protein [Myxococcota bacterium]|nr:hemolysin III family protein [Myxococcota bacterium]
MSIETETSGKGPKPKGRGISHLLAAVLAIPAAIFLIRHAVTDDGSFAASIYGPCLISLFAVSAVYHVPMWRPQPRALLRRLDRSMIYIFIAGTYTPVCIGLGESIWAGLLPTVWAAAGVGIAFTLLGQNWPRYVTATPYVVLGWGAVMVLPALWTHYGPAVFWLMCAGGIPYTVGAMVYAKRWPNPYPRYFGYHEIFHFLVIVAAVLHYMVVYVVLTQPVSFDATV